MSNKVFNDEELPGRIPGPKGGRSRKSAPGGGGGGGGGEAVLQAAYISLLRGRVRLMDGGLDRSSGGGVSG